jgi:hypothetical protein
VLRKSLKIKDGKESDEEEETVPEVKVVKEAVAEKKEPKKEGTKHYVKT